MPASQGSAQVTSLARSNFSSAAAFVSARRAGASLKIYPGPKPQDLVAAYRIQDEAIRLWNGSIGGWKVGRILPPFASAFGEDRLVGPIFADQIQRTGASIVEMPVFEGGFAAVEGEFVILLRDDAPAGKTVWSDAEGRALIAAVHAGIEVASSPYPRINDDGPLVTISDFGNNAGLLIGPELPNWRDFDLPSWTVETYLDGVPVGSGAATGIPGGPVDSLRAALAICARRGRPLRRGMAVSTGAVSGVHEARIGQTAEVRFAGLSTLRCTMATARAMVSPA